MCMHQEPVLQRFHKTSSYPIRHLTKPWGTGDHLRVHLQVLLLWHCRKSESLVYAIVHEGLTRHRCMAL